MHGTSLSYSLDLRERVVASVVRGKSCREVAALFDVSVASVVKWSQRARVSGSPAAKPMGGRRPYVLAGERDWLLLSVRRKKPSGQFLPFRVRPCRSGGGERAADEPSTAVELAAPPRTGGRCQKVSSAVRPAPSSPNAHAVWNCTGIRVRVDASRALANSDTLFWRPLGMRLTYTPRHAWCSAHPHR
jgi:hypothetical protein